MDLDEFLESLMKTETVSKFPVSMYYSEGTKYLNLFQYETALEFFNEAVKCDPTDFKALLKRSKCLICLRRYEKAIDDANNVLKLYPESVQAIDLKGQAQYLMGDFEGGYLTYSKGREMKPLSNELRLGKQLCEEALNNALSPSLGIKLKQEDVASMAYAKEDHKKFENRLRYRKSRRDYFDADIKFLTDLMKDKNLTSIHDSCKEAVDFIKHRQRFWGMETPLHSRKKKQTVKRKEIKKNAEGEKMVQICLAAKRRAENELLKGRIDYCISEALMFLKFAESFPKQREKEGMKFQCDAYHLLSCAYNKAGNSRLVYQYLMKELKVAYEFNLLLPQVRGSHQLGKYYQLAGNVEGAIECLHQVANADIEKLMKEKCTTKEVRELYEAMDWAELNRDVEFKRVEPKEMGKIKRETTEDLGIEFLESSELKTDDTESLIDDLKRTEDEQESSRSNRYFLTDESDESRANSKTDLSNPSEEEDINSETEEVGEKSIHITQGEELDNLVNNDNIEKKEEDSILNLSENTEQSDGLHGTSILEPSNETDDSSRLNGEKQFSDADRIKHSSDVTVELSKSRSGEVVRNSNFQEQREWGELNIQENEEESKELSIRKNEEARETSREGLIMGDDTEMNNDPVVEANLMLHDSSDSEITEESKELRTRESEEARGSSNQDLIVGEDTEMLDDSVKKETSKLNESLVTEIKEESKELSARKSEEARESNSQDLAVGEYKKMIDDSVIEETSKLDDSAEIKEKSKELSGLENEEAKGSSSQDLIIDEDTEKIDDCVIEETSKLNESVDTDK